MLSTSTLSISRKIPPPPTHHKHPPPPFKFPGTGLRNCDNHNACLRLLLTCRTCSTKTNPSTTCTEPRGKITPLSPCKTKVLNSSHDYSMTTHDFLEIIGPSKTPSHFRRHCWWHLTVAMTYSHSENSVKSQ
jgi:hypothetical protein